MSRLAMAYTINSRYPRFNVFFPYAIFFREFSQDRGMTRVRGHFCGARRVNIIITFSLSCLSPTSIFRRPTDINIVTLARRTNINEHLDISINERAI